MQVKKKAKTMAFIYIGAVLLNLLPAQEVSGAL
jgi:hypothetical protein